MQSLPRPSGAQERRVAVAPQTSFDPVSRPADRPNFWMKIGLPCWQPGELEQVLGETPRGQFGF